MNVETEQTAIDLVPPCCLSAPTGHDLGLTGILTTQLSGQISGYRAM